MATPPQEPAGLWPRPREQGEPWAVAAGSAGPWLRPLEPAGPWPWPWPQEPAGLWSRPRERGEPWLRPSHRRCAGTSRHA
jgi:hypothetical protein